jgi:Skp family chaperone for outer membrane proteins
MLVSSRAIVAVGLGLVGVGCLVGPTFGQGGDSAVRKTNNTTTAATSAPKPPAPAIFGTVDIEAVFKNYDKVKAQQEEFKAAAMSRHNELIKIQTEAQEEASKLQKLTPNSVDAKKIEDKLTQLKARLEADRENAQRDFALRESEMLATLYKEVQAMVARIAEYKGMTYVIQVSNEPVSGSNPNSVMAAMAKTVVYASPANDITKDVVFNLNRTYKAAGGVVPKAAGPAAGATPAGNGPPGRGRAGRAEHPGPPPRAVMKPRAPNARGRSPTRVRARHEPAGTPGRRELSPTIKDDGAGKACTPRGASSARSPGTRKSVVSVSSTAMTWPCGSGRPRPKRASSSSVPTCRAGPRSGPTSPTSSRARDARRSSKGRPPSRWWNMSSPRSRDCGSTTV